jgi:hypothetical protein
VAAAVREAFALDVAALEETYAAIFKSMRLRHFTAEQLFEAGVDGEIPRHQLEAAKEQRAAMEAKVRWFLAP